MDLKDLRREYSWGALEEDKVATDPIDQFQKWFQDYTTMDVPDSTAMILATAGKDGVPKSRVVLLKEVIDDEFIFYSNYNSQKGQDMAENEHVSLLFFWPEMERQIRIQGTVRKAGDALSDKYFNQRPFESRVSAIISPQSETVPGREHLENKVFEFLEAHPDESEKLERPEYWGGYCVKPYSIEFWQGRISRLHDRLRYVKTGDSWKLERLAP